MDTRALYPQETALGGLCEVRYVSGQPQSPVSHQGYVKTYKNGSKNHLRDVQLCPSFQQLLHTLNLICQESDCILENGLNSMPPAAVKTIRDLLYWQYSKIISASAGFGKSQFGFIMDRFKKLQSGEIEWSGSIQEYIREREMPNQCIYCGATENLSYDHLVPQSRSGPDIPDNVVMACRKCNSSKGGRGLYEWLRLDKRNEVPRIAEGKYLKLLYHLHDERGSLDIGRSQLEMLCTNCELSYLCDESALTVYCLESVLAKKP